MSWTELRIHTTAEAIDWVSTLLASIDYGGDIYTTPYNPLEDSALEENASEVEDSSPPHPNWTFTICLYFPERSSSQTQFSRQINQIDDLLFPLYRTGLTTRAEFAHVEEKPPSSEAPLNQIHRIGQRFVIVPLQSTSSSEEIAANQPQRSDELILKLGTSLAFGSGLHPTTMLCLQLLEKYVQPGMNTLDLGSGSGILSIALAKLGAKVLAIDNDPVAVEATTAAVNQNQLTEQVTVMQGSLGSGSALGHWMGSADLTSVPNVKPNREFDLIISNVFARIQTTLAESFAQALQRTTPNNGVLITAGYTLDYQEQINEAMIAVGFEAIDRLQSDEWISLVHCLKNNEES